MLAFTHIPETVNGSFESILRRSFGIGHYCMIVPRSRRNHPIFAADELRRTSRAFPWLASISGRGIVPFGDLPSAFPDLRFYTFLREPIDRCASEYVRQFNDQSGKDILNSFADWIQQPEVRNRQCLQICGVPDASTAIWRLNSNIQFVGLIERFHESLVMFARWTGNTRVDVRYHLRKQAMESHLKKKLLSNIDSRRLLIEANREDVRLYDEVRRNVFPRQCEEYGDQLERSVQTFEAFNVPPSRISGELLSLMMREVVYRPLASVLANRSNPTIHVTRVTKPIRRRAA